MKQKKGFLYRITHTVENGFDLIVMFFIGMIILYSLYCLYDMWSIYGRAQSLRDGISQYRPTDISELRESFEALRKINPDICAWIVVDGTNISYPVVKGKDDFEYLDKDIYGEYAAAGSIFVEKDTPSDFTAVHNILMGHHMKGGVMFGPLDDFRDQVFFDNHRTGVLLLPDRICYLESVAMLEADAYDRVIFGHDAGINTIYAEIKSKAVTMADDIKKTPEKLVSLSTCMGVNNRGRILLSMQITEEVLAE